MEGSFANLAMLVPHLRQDNPIQDVETQLAPVQELKVELEPESEPGDVEAPLDHPKDMLKSQEDKHSNSDDTEGVARQYLSN